MRLAGILAAHWESFAASHGHLLTGAHYRAARALRACRTAELGGQLFECPSCARQHFVYHSCNHRACPQCGALDQQQWAAAQEARLLPVPYFLLTFTLPEGLRALSYGHQSWFYDAMFQAAAETLRDFSEDPKHLGGTPGFTMVLHTWTRQMLYHPHLHVIMPGVALSQDGLRLYRAKHPKYLFPFRALAAAFAHRLRKAWQRRLSLEASSQRWPSLDPAVWTQAWVVDVRAAGNARAALRYLARYVHKTAVSESRLLGYTPEGRIRLNSQNSRTGRWRQIALQPQEFLRRWSLHILPKGLVRVRHYGFLSSAAAKKFLRVHQILQSTAAPKPPALKPPVPVCPCCAQPMRLKLSFQPFRVALVSLCQLPSRAPPPLGP